MPTSTSITPNARRRFAELSRPAMRAPSGAATVAPSASHAAIARSIGSVAW